MKINELPTPCYVIDEKKLRPVDVPIIEPDINKIRKEVGWQPVISLKQTLKEIYNGLEQAL